jgi:hypothetical protein
MGKDLHKVSSTAGRSKQSSIRNDTNPGPGAWARAATMYSIDFLSIGFCEISRNCRLFAYESRINERLDRGTR